MKRWIQCMLIVCLLASLLGCRRDKNPPVTLDKDTGVTLRVSTSYGGDDGNRKLYEEALDAFQSTHKVNIQDDSAVASENWKARVLTDFLTGSEPDVLFFFANADANPIIDAGKVVSVEEIRQEYPDYAENLQGSLFTVASGFKHYAVPSTGYWETFFVNKKVFRQCGLTVPGPDYTWSRFLKDCQVIKEKGYIPIACSLDEIPHYWFEFTILNNGTVYNQYQRPHLDRDGQLIDDPVSRKWIQALEDLRSVYEAGYFSPNTLSARDNITVSQFAEGKAAFLLDGSWKVGYLIENYPDKLEDYAVSFFPGKGARPATDIIGGVSMGYFISRRAWEDPQKRDLAVKFVSYMTSDEVRNTFATTDIFPIGDGENLKDLNPLQKSVVQAIPLFNHVTGAVQDSLSGDARRSIFSSIPDVVTGRVSPAEAIEQAIKLN